MFLNDDYNLLFKGSPFNVTLLVTTITNLYIVIHTNEAVKDNHISEHCLLKVWDLPTHACTDVL